MAYDYNLEEIKSSLTIEQVFELVNELGGDPQMVNATSFCSRTICHGGDSRKLYYYDNGSEGIFHCYTECSDSFDLFQLVRKVKSLELGNDYSLPAAVTYVANYFGFSKTDLSADEENSLKDYFNALDRYSRIQEINIQDQKAELKEYDGSFLKNLPFAVISDWAEEGITRDVMNDAGIKYEPRNQVIVIPHYDIDNRLIGIRQRTLIKEDAEKYGKYRPLFLMGKQYNHPLGFSLYNLNKSKDNIRRMKTAIVFEGEKSSLQYRSYFGADNDISVAVCGSSLTQFQFNLLKECGAENIIIAFDKCGADNDLKKYVQKFYNIQKKFGNYCNLNFIYDKDNEFLDFKMSPTDKGKETFLNLYRRRISLYG